MIPREEKNGRKEPRLSRVWQALRIAVTVAWPLLLAFFNNWLGGTLLSSLSLDLKN